MARHVTRYGHQTRVLLLSRVRLLGKWNMRRRDFLKCAAASMAVPNGWARDRGISLVLASGDPVAAAAPVQWAAQELQRALAAKGRTVRRVSSADQAPQAALCIL